MKRSFILSFAVFISLWVYPFAARAGQPLPWQMNFQPPASSVAEHIQEFHHFVLIIITCIAAFVLMLLVFVILRFNRRANPEPARFAHNVPLEVLWTVVPLVILIVIAVPSFRLLYYVDRAENPEMTLKVTGYQWYWGYEYPDHGGLNFLAYLVPEEEIDPAAGQKRLLSTDNAVVLPTDTDIAIQVTAADVLHAWAVPALGIKIDAIPGRLNETWVRITRPGIYYGQCSELCGKDHAYMPIEIHAVPRAEFEAWLGTAREELSLNLHNPPAYLPARRTSS